MIYTWYDLDDPDDLYLVWSRLSRISRLCTWSINRSWYVLHVDIQWGTRLLKTTPWPTQRSYPDLRAHSSYSSSSRLGQKISLERIERNAVVHHYFVYTRRSWKLVDPVGTWFYLEYSAGILIIVSISWLQYRYVDYSIGILIIV